jgi:hypothetical protein
MNGRLLAVGDVAEVSEWALASKRGCKVSGVVVASDRLRCSPQRVLKAGSRPRIEGSAGAAALPERLEVREKDLISDLEALRQWMAIIETFYARLSEQQRRGADELLNDLFGAPWAELPVENDDGAPPGYRRGPQVRASPAAFSRKRRQPKAAIDDGDAAPRRREPYWNLPDTGHRSGG